MPQRLFFRVIFLISERKIINNFKMPQRLFFRVIFLISIFSIDLSSSTEEGIYNFLFTNEPNTTEQSIVKTLYANSKISVVSESISRFKNVYKITDNVNLLSSRLQIRRSSKRDTSTMETLRTSLLSYGRSTTRNHGSHTVEAIR
uniref:Uncharacterized protein n=1 Tax=Megaselia scalaris TaxID=36166 RepID=T1H1M2_MEGSC